MTIEELLCDESFTGYCRASSPEDIRKWEWFVKEHPEQRAIIERARERFIELFNAIGADDLEEQVAMLSQRLEAAQPAPVIPMLEPEKRSRRIPFLLKVGVAALVLVVGYFVFYQLNPAPPANNDLRVFEALNGERKSIQLPDGSVVTLNAGSSLHMGSSFGGTTREIFLEGEAFFDVKPDKHVPFIVHTPAVDVRAVGTAFNVKAYPKDDVVETSLVSGIVEVTLKDKDNTKLLLRPNQKVQWALSRNEKTDKSQPAAPAADTKNVAIANMVLTDDGDRKEIAWTQNKLIFDGDSFSDIGSLLERWYGVKVEFMDQEIRDYRFTGVFEKEELGTVLRVLKESRDFNYELIRGNETIVRLYK